ncbi:hypothetical protein [Streptomyces sp. NPDC051546]|uniref:hypothetical protein n=1 Tax=Streptomyces sp. NPDC051546 TaxID=3365655 RepID=UPI003795B449
MTADRDDVLRLARSLAALGRKDGVLLHLDEPQPSAALWRQQCSTPEELGTPRPPAAYWAKTA